MSDSSYSHKSPSPIVIDNSAADDKKCYPTVSINKEVWDKIGLPVDLVPGDRIKATVEFCVTRVERSEGGEESYDGGGSLGLNLEDIEPEEIIDSEKGGESTKEKSKEEEMLGYKRDSSSEKSKIKPASGKDLSEY